MHARTHAHTLSLSLTCAAGMQGDAHALRLACAHSSERLCHDTGNLQQQAAAAGALQALAFCPSRGPTYARIIATHDALTPLVDMLEKGPVPMCCAAAGALCNLALACPENQVRGHTGGVVVHHNMRMSSPL